MPSSAGTIVVGIDESQSSGAAVAWAEQQAVAEHRGLTLVHTVHRGNPLSVERSSGAAAAAMRTEGQRLLDATRMKIEWMTPDLDVHQVLEMADPREVLLELSSSAAMLVVGSRGRGRMSRLLLGSVSAALVRHAHCPVVVHRSGDPGIGRTGIVVGADGSPDSLPVLEFAYRVASLRGQPLTVLQCSWDVQMGTTETRLPAENTPDRERERPLLAETMAVIAEKYPDVQVTPQVARGLPQQALVTLGEQMSMVVVGSHRSGRLAQMLHGSMSLSVVEHASCTVAVVPLLHSE